MKIGRGIVTERMKTVWVLDSEAKLCFAEAVGNVAREKVGDIALRMDPLDHEVWKQNTANRAGSLWGLDDP